MPISRSRALLAGVVILFGCSAPEAPPAPEITRFEPEYSGPPAARWDHLPQSERWTQAVLAALDGHGAPLVELVPADAETWCPAYPEATRDERKAFWVGLLSSLAKHESTWRPDVSGGEGRWHGLLQISPATARGYGCRATSAEALKSGPANLSCGIRIMGVTVPRDGVIAAGGGGVAADWGPFSQASKRSDMRNWVRQQPYCQG